MSLTWQQHFGAAVTRVIDERVGSNPYFTVVLLGLVRRECYAVQTLAVTDNGIMLVNPNGILTMSNEELAGGLVHEVMHVVLKHADRAKLLGISQESHQIWNRAADSVINDQLRDAGLVLPEWVVYPETLKQPKGLTAEESYKRLLDEQQQQENEQGGGQGQPGEGEGEGEGEGNVGNGACGSCSGHAHKGELEKRSDKPDPQARSEADIESWRRQVAEGVREAAGRQGGSGRGTIPSDLVRWAEEYLQPAKIDWRTKLQQAVREAVAYRAGMVDLYYGRPSRRQGGLGFGAGRAIMPAYRAPVPKVAVIVDTSGSMGAEDLQEAISETNGVLQAVGAPVTFVACDAEVHGITPIEDPQAIKELLKGGGGTRMEPAFQALRDLPERPDVVICCTDGHIDVFEDQEWCRAIWVVVGQEAHGQPNKWGETILVDSEGAHEEVAA